MFVTRYKTQTRISMCAAIEHEREKESSNYSWPRPSRRRRRRQPYSAILHEQTHQTLQMLRSTNRLYNLYSDWSIKHLYSFLHHSLSLFLRAYGIGCVTGFTLSANQRQRMITCIRIGLEPYERGWRDKSLGGRR